MKLLSLISCLFSDGEMKATLEEKFLIEAEYIHQCRSYVTSQSLAQEGRCQVAKC